ncbi:hypothetical protein JOM56_001631 [Amanita muscaria]
MATTTITRHSAKEMIQQLKDDMNHLKEAEMRWKEISINWEIRSRLTQVLNDVYSKTLSKEPKLAYHRLKAAGHGYLPYLFAAWAINQCKIPVPNEIDDVQLDRYTRKIVSLRDESLTGDITSVWNAIPSTARNLMITMWIKRDTSPSGIGLHPTPSVKQALCLIRLDCDLTEAEIELAKRVIPGAVGKQGNRLFSDDSSS